MKAERLRETLEVLIGSDARPVVTYAALWPFMRAMEEIPVNDIPQTILNLLINVVGSNRSLLMPTFASGYKNGICNLDKEPSTTGLLSELFRKHPQTRRSLSAFFSFNILGPETPGVVSLQPKNAWGDGSMYEWMEKNNVHFLMLGTHPTSCSYLHRMEWLNRDIINYRYDKRFEGILLREGTEYPVQETLYVRSLNPPVINDYTVIYNDLKKGGMSVVMLDGVYIAHMRAEDMKNVYMKLLKKDPFLTVQNRCEFESLVNGSSCDK